MTAPERRVRPAASAIPASAGPGDADDRAAPPACSPHRFYAYWIFALAAAVSAFCAHVYVRQRVVELGYDLGRERALRQRLENDRRNLEKALAALEAPEDLARIARDELGFDIARDDQIVEQEPPGTPRPRPATVAVPASPVPVPVPPTPATTPMPTPTPTAPGGAP